MAESGHLSIRSKLTQVGLVGWFGSDQAGSCVLTQCVDPSQVEAGWGGWLASCLAGWLVGLGPTRLGRVV